VKRGAEEGGIAQGEDEVRGNEKNIPGSGYDSEEVPIGPI